MQNWPHRIYLTQTQKTLLTLLIIFVIIASGLLFQREYHARTERYTQEITGFYRKYFDREPDAIGLKHWVTWALNKWNIKKVEQKGFAEAAERKGAV